jgi:hypothetical protein
MHHAGKSRAKALHGSAAGQPQGITPIWDTPGAIACGASLTHAYGHKAWRIYLFIYGKSRPVSQP